MVKLKKQIKMNKIMGKKDESPYWGDGPGLRDHLDWSKKNPNIFEWFAYLIFVIPTKDYTLTHPDLIFNKIISD